MTPPNYSLADFEALAPAILLALGGIALLVTEVFQTSPKRGYQAWLTVAFAGLAAFTALPMLKADPRPILAIEGRGAFAVADRFGGFVAILICLGLALSALVAAGFLRARNAERGEYYGLALFAASGMVLLGQSTDLLMIFISIEIMSVAVYALAAYLRRGAKPAEAAFKYFILGAFSSGLYIYGAALVYGATGGKTALVDIAKTTNGGALLGFGVALLLAGFAFKVAAVPFHMWTPDVYEGAPTPVTAFMAAGVKAAAFAALVRVLTIAFGSEGVAMGDAGWGEAVAWLAMATMLVGNLLAVAQRSVKRLLAYSSIAHAGYLLVGVAAAREVSVRAAANEGLLYYLAAYTFTAIGAFGVISVLEKSDSEQPMSWDLDRFAGLAKSRPAMAFAMAVFMLSLAGIPPTAGFVGKLFLFKAAVDAKLYALAIAGILTSVIGAWYYLRVVVTMYMREQEPSLGEAPAAPIPTSVALVAAVLGTVLLGVLPSLLSEVVKASGAVLGGG